MRQHKKIPPFLLPLLCGCFLVTLSLTLFLTPDKTYSDDEKRALATAPQFSLQALFDGTYTQQLGDYFSDQFPLRTAFVRLKTSCERWMLRGENNGVLFGKDGYLIARAEYTDAQYAVLERNLRAVNDFSLLLAAEEQTANIPFYLAAVPRSVDVNQIHLPDGYGADAQTVWTRLSQATQDTALSMVDLREPLTRAADDGTQVWFRTDHHWTTEGAYLAYVALGDVLGYTPYNRDAFTLEEVSDDFLGTTYSSAGLTTEQADSITLWRYQGDENYRTDIYQGGTVVRSLSGFYDTEALEGKDQYSVFLGGTNAHIRVEPSESSSLPTLILIKDSYAQSLAPFLARHYRLILLDPRSYRSSDTQPSIFSMIKQEQPTAVLLLCGIDTLCGDMDLRTLLITQQ